MNAHFTLASTAAVVGIASACFSIPGRAQVRVEITPLLGAFTPTAAIVRYSSPYGCYPEDYTSSGRCPNSGLLGAVARQRVAPVVGGVGTVWPGARFAAELSVSYAASEVGPYDYAAHVLATSARFLVLLAPGTARVSPYVAAGWAAVMHWGLAWDSVTATNYPVSGYGPGQFTSWGPTAAVGFRTQVARSIAVRGELQGYSYATHYGGLMNAPPRQNDLIAWVGVSAALAWRASRRSSTDAAERQ